nr:NAD(P)-dependent oxidoreductase [Nitratireductor luteus]
MSLNLYGRTVGIVDTGEIGAVLARILKAFGCKLLGDVSQNPARVELSMRYVPREELWRGATSFRCIAILQPAKAILPLHQIPGRRRPQGPADRLALDQGGRVPCGVPDGQRVQRYR